VILFPFFSCKAPPVVNDGGTEGIQVDDANDQQGSATHGMSV
jgi:hypothetical protein